MKQQRIPMRRATALSGNLVPLVLAALLLTCGIAHCAEVTVEENVTYGKGGDTELKLDMARPEGDGPFPAIVFIHGGGWYQGKGGTPTEAAERYKAASPVNYVSTDDPPVLTLHGDQGPVLKEILRN